MKIYLSKEYDYRRWYTLLGGVIASVFGAVILFCFVIPSASRADWHGPFTVWSILGLLLSIGIPTLLLSAGVWIIHAWMTRRVNRLEVSDLGVQYGTCFRRWEEIKWFSCHQLERGKPTLFYQKKGFSFDYNLMVTDPISENEILSLFENLERDVSPVQPDLEIG
jgi:hypothetical protein